MPKGKKMIRVVRGTLLDEESDLTLDELCGICRQRRDVLMTMVEEGILDPLGGDDTETWRFPSISVTKVRIVLHLQRDLGVNLAGAALVLDLLKHSNR